MSKTPDDVKKGLEITSSDCLMCECCVTDCPYDLECHPCNKETNTNVPKAMLHDALTLIQQLESDKQQLEGMLAHMNQLRDAAAGRALKMDERVHQLEAERDAAVACLKKAANEKGECFGCKWYNGKNCTNPDYKMLCSSHDDKWEWRGVQKEESK